MDLNEIGCEVMGWNLLV